MRYRMSRGYTPPRETGKPVPPDASAPAQLEFLRSEIDRTIGSQVPQKQRERIVETVTMLIKTEAFSGPIAHPMHLEAYERILPGSADRIIAMAEERLRHEALLDKEFLKAEKEDRKIGMILGAGLFACLIASALITALLFQDPALSGIFLGTAVLGGIALFIRGRGGAAK